MTPTMTMTSEHKLDIAGAIRMYCFGGRAVFTLVSPRTGRRFTYKMTLGKNEFHGRSYEIRLLQGDDNTEDYHFIGRYYCDSHNLWLRQSEDLYSSRAIRHLLTQTDTYLRNGLEFWTSGRCAKCGRLLTDPESIASGFGPHCGGRR